MTDREQATRLQEAFGPGTPTYECLTEAELAVRISADGLLKTVLAELDALDVYLDRVGASTADFYAEMHRVRNRLLAAGLCTDEDLDGAWDED